MTYLRKLFRLFRRAVATVDVGQGAPQSVTLRHELFGALTAIVVLLTGPSYLSAQPTTVLAENPTCVAIKTASVEGTAVADDCKDSQASGGLPSALVADENPRLGNIPVPRTGAPRTGEVSHPCGTALPAASGTALMMGTCYDQENATCVLFDPNGHSPPYEKEGACDSDTPGCGGGPN